MKVADLIKALNSLGEQAQAAEVVVSMDSMVCMGRLSDLPHVESASQTDPGFVVLWPDRDVGEVA